MNDCNEWKKEKYHSCPIIRRVKTQIMQAALCHIAAGMGHKISGHLNFVPHSKQLIRCAPCECLHLLIQGHLGSLLLSSRVFIAEDKVGDKGLELP
jgi:hypothetical protein